MKTLKKIFIPVVRVPLILLFILLNPLVRLFVKYDYIFFTYAAGKKDIRGYGPVFISRLLPLIIPVGYLKKKEGVGRGIMLGTAKDARYFAEPGKISSMFSTLETWRGKTGARSIAIGGQLPSVIVKRGIDIAPPFVKGVYGTVYILDSIISAIVKERNIDPGKFTAGIIGIGFIGAPLARRLAEIYSRVVAVDNRLDPSASWPSNVEYTDEHSKLASTDLTVLLTGRGDDAASAFHHFKQGIIIVDDAHPQLSREYIQKVRDEKQGSVFKAVVGLPGVRYVPKLPGFRADWVPGCAVEGIVAARFGYNYNSQEEFNRLADELGFQPIIEGHVI